MKCLNCQNEINDNSNFCEYCGKKVEKQVIKSNYCVKCGNKLDGGNFCSNCGMKVHSNNKVITLNITRKKRTMGFAVPFTVHVDGIIIGKLKNGCTLSCNITLGKHQVNIESVEKNTIQEINVNENTNSVEIVVVAKLGFVAATAKLVDIIYK